MMIRRQLGRVGWLFLALALGVALAAVTLGNAGALAEPQINTEPLGTTDEHRWVEPVSTPEPEAPQGLIAGAVYDPQENPVAGSEVSFYTREWAFVDATLTDAEGFYSLALSDVITQYYGIAWPPAGSPYTYSVWNEIEVPAGGEAFADFWLQGPLLAGYVRDQFGEAVEGAQLYIYNADRSIEVWEYSQWDGHFLVAYALLPGETYTVEVQGPWNMGYVAPAPFTVTPVDLTVAIELYLPPVSAYGYVFYPDGRPAEEAQVSFGNDGFWEAIYAWEDGYFEMRGLPGGQYNVSAEPPWPITGYLSTPSQLVDIAAEGEPLDLGNFVLLYGRKTLQGRFSDAKTGAAVTDAYISAERLDGYGYGYAEPNAQGYYSMTLEGGLWQVSINAKSWPAPWGYTTPIPKLAFGLPPAEYETKTMDFAVSMADARVIGSVLCPDGLDCLTYGEFAGGPPVLWVGFWNNLFGNGAELSANTAYTFSVPLLSGWYEGGLWPDSNRLHAPAIPPFYLAPGQTLDLGVLELAARTATIRGRVTDEGGAPLAGIEVYSWSQDESLPGDWTQTDAQGAYTLTALAGTWFVEPNAADGRPYVHTAGARVVKLNTPTSEANGVDFQMTFADAFFDGRLVDAATQAPLDALYGGWAWSEQLNPPEGSAAFSDGSSILAGRFGLRAKGGNTYRLYVYTPPESGYLPAYQDEAIGIAETRTVTIALQATDSLIRGYFMDAAKNAPITNRWLGWLSAVRSDGYWAEAEVNTDDGSFEIPVTEGVWTLYLWLEEGAGAKDFVISNPAAVVTVTAGQTVTQNLRLWPADALAYGQLLTPDGDPAAGAFVSAWGYSDAAGYYETWAQVNDNGEYSLTLLAGVYSFYASLPWEEMQSRAWLPGYVENITVTAGAPVELSGLLLRALDGEIMGAVRFDVAFSQVQPIGPVYLWAWSEGGGWTEGWAEFEEEDDLTSPAAWVANYILPVLAGDIWHIGAVYEDWETGAYYYSEEAVVDLTEVSQVDVDLRLSGMGFLVQPLAIGFDPTQAQFIRLPNGASLEIPANAIVPQNGGRITLYLTPSAALQETGVGQTVSLGYNIWVMDESGREISEFEQNIRVTLPYDSDEALAARGVSEDGLTPTYFSTLLGRWTLMESFTQDKQANTLTFLTNHFSKFRIGTNNVTPATPELKKIMLPMLRRSN